MKSELLMATRTPVDDMYGSPATDCTYLSVSSPVREVSSAPGSRSCSFKKSHSHRRPQDLELSVEDVSRPRTNSLPSCAARRRRRARHASGGSSPPAPCEGDHGYGGERGASDTRLCRVRSFKLTAKGLVNHGDSFKRMSTHSLMSSGSATTVLSEPGACSGEPRPEPRPRAHSLTSQESSGVVSGTGSCCAPSYFRVALLGAPGVGKTALLRQFMTSEYRGTFDMATPDAEDPETTVSVLLDGEESMIEFIDIDDSQDSDLDGLGADAFIVVFSLADHESYSWAVARLRQLRVDMGLDRAILLVGNKVDLARQRRVTAKEARVLALKYDSQYEETSAALNHHVDHLLVAALSQIRHRLSPPSDCSSPSSLLTAKVPLVRCCSPSPSPSPRRAMSFLSKLFHQARKRTTRSCDNLLIQ